MKTVMGFLLGALVGAALALLYAPSTGDELRANLKSQADSQYTKLQGEWQRGMQEVHDRMDKLNNDLQAITSKVKDTDKTV